MINNRFAILSRSCSGAIVFFASVFGMLINHIPTVLAATVPEKITFVSADTVRIIEPAIFLSWFSATDKMVLDPNQIVEGENRPASCLRIPFFCETFVPETSLIHFIRTSALLVNKDKVTADLPDFLDALERDPINAKLGMDSDKQLSVVSEAVPGLRINHAESITTTIQALEANRSTNLRIELPTETVSAKVSRETIADLGLHDLIAQGITNFRGSPKNRIFNIHRAIEQFDGVVIPPGETFSFVQYLGDVDGEHGYLPELVIKNNKTEPEFGGGICQVSTTVFRAALKAGLQITERRNHAYPVQYYKPYGMDATVYIPRPDLKFKNNTPGSILMLPSITGTELSFSFYGTNDGRTTTLDGPHILESNPDGSMRTIFTQIVKDKNGDTLIDQDFPSNYKSPSLFPHPGQEPVFATKPKDWSERQWKEYKAIHP